MLRQKNQSIHLPPWSELVGTFEGLSIDQDFIYVKVSESSLALQNESDEAAYVQKRLENSIVGRKIAILRTDMPGKPLLVRLVSEGLLSGR
jgi:hypothetical protein